MVQLSILADVARMLNILMSVNRLSQADNAGSRFFNCYWTVALIQLFSVTKHSGYAVPVEAPSNIPFAAWHCFSIGVSILQWKTTRN